jgi:hypothetical protein
MADFQRTSWGWQLEQIQQRLGEWIEVKFRGVLPNQTLPAWLIAAMGYFFWLLLLSGLAWFSYWLFNYYRQKNSRRRRIVQPTVLPVKISTVAELLARAQQLQSQNNYTEACRCLYLAMLQRLNDADLISHQTSRTDREYADLLRQLPSLQSIAVLFRTHEQLQFADRAISAAGFDSCQQAYQQLDQHLKQKATP